MEESKDLKKRTEVGQVSMQSIPGYLVYNSLIYVVLPTLGLLHRNRKVNPMWKIDGMGVSHM